MSLYQSALFHALRRQFTSRMGTNGVELVMALLDHHTHIHDTDHPGDAGHVTCLSCGHIQDKQRCPTVSTAIRYSHLDTAAVEASYTAAVREQKIENLASVLCRQFGHTHEGRPRCSGYVQAALRVDAHDESHVDDTVRASR